MTLHTLKKRIKQIVPRTVYRPFVTRWRRLKSGRWDGTRRLVPFSDMSGLDRGTPVDRFYIEDFLQEHAADVQGHVGEIMDSAYTRRFGGSRVTRAHILDIDAGNPHATIVCNLETGQGVPDNVLDCLIITQTYSSIYDVRAAVANSFRALKPGGVLLATVPGIAKILRFAYDDYGEYWRFTTLSARRLFEETFPAENVSIKAGGNVFVATAFLYGLVVEELTLEELNYFDRDYELILAIRAVKPAPPDRGGGAP